MLDSKYGSGTNIFISSLFLAKQFGGRLLNIKYFFSEKLGNKSVELTSRGYCKD